MKKFLSVLFALFMAMSALPALGKEMLPLAEPVTFRINVATANNVSELEKSPYYQEMLERTNVKIELVSLGQYGEDALTMLQLLYNSGDYGDAIWGGSLIAEADYSQLAAANILADLKPYIEDTAVMPNFNSVVLAESPNTKAFITAPDGGIYSLPGYNTEPGAYLEGPICINAKWMETLGREYAAFMAGEFQKARLIQFGINRIVAVLLRHGCIPTIKEALTLKGFDAGHVAYPGKRFDAEERRQLAEELRAAGYEI